MARTIEEAAYALRYNVFAKTTTPAKETASMKCSRAEVHCKTHSLPVLRFEDSQLTSYSGLILIQELFVRLGLKERLRRCFSHLTVSPIFGYPILVLCLVVHLLLGYRQLRDIRYYADDPLVKRILGLRRLPDVATVSRALAGADQESVRRLQGLLRDGVLARLAALRLPRVTLDFDGSVIGTGRWAEGTAVGFNRKKKGQRSYYPLFCTVAQTGQVFDVLHDPATSMTPTVPETSSSPVSPRYGPPSLGSALRCAWTVRFSAMKSSGASTPKVWSIR